MKHLIATLLLAAGAASASDVAKEIEFGEFRTDDTVVALYDIPGSCSNKMMGAAKSFPNSTKSFVMGCWETKDNLVYLKFEDGTSQVIPRNAITMGARYKKRWVFF